MTFAGAQGLYKRRHRINLPVYNCMYILIITSRMKMRSLVLIVLVVAYSFIAVKARVIFQSESDDQDVEGYYWRDYTGDISKDALPAGKNINGSTTYIGQVLHRDKLIPARIDPADKKVYFEWGFAEFVANKNIKILCTMHPEGFHWVSTTSGSINNLSEKYFVSGGYEDGVTTLIGRKQLKNELVVGKVVSTKTQATLNVTKDGKSIQHNKFDILTYNPSSNNAQESKIKKNDKIGNTSNDNLELSYKQKSVIINVYN